MDNHENSCNAHNSINNNFHNDQENYYGNNNNIQKINANKIENSSFTQNNISSDNDINELFNKLKEEFSKLPESDIKDDAEYRIKELEEQIQEPKESKLKKIKKWFVDHRQVLAGMTSIVLQIISMLQ
jgi:hypothetical protein